MLDWGKIPSTSFSLGCFLRARSHHLNIPAYKVLGGYSFPFFLQTSNRNLPFQYDNWVEGISSSAVVTGTTPSQCTSAVTLLAAHLLQMLIHYPPISWCFRVSRKGACTHLNFISIAHWLRKTWHSHGTTTVDKTSDRLQTGLKLAETDQNWLAGWKTVTINRQKTGFGSSQIQTKVTNNNDQSCQPHDMQASETYQKMSEMEVSKRETCLWK